MSPIGSISAATKPNWHSTETILLSMARPRLSELLSDEIGYGTRADASVQLGLIRHDLYGGSQGTSGECMSNNL